MNGNKIKHWEWGDKFDGEEGKGRNCGGVMKFNVEANVIWWKRLGRGRAGVAGGCFKRV